MRILIPCAVAAYAVLVAACGGPNFSDGDFRCGLGPQACPPGFTCAANGFCRSSSTVPDAAGSIDSGIDAGPPDANFCGNAMQETGEECDDGNTADGDGCDSNCTLTACGNGISSVGEICFQVTASLPMGVDARNVALGDMNGDGDIDIVTVDRSSNLVNTRLNSGTSTFETLIQDDTGVGAIDVAVGQLFGDPTLDAITADQVDESITVLLGEGDGHLGLSESQSLNSGAAPSCVALLNVNGDTQPDAVVLESGLGVLHAFTNDAGFFSPGAAVTAPMGAIAMAVADLDGSGADDVIVSDPNLNQIAVYMATGFATLNPSVAYPAGTLPRGIAIFDAEPDGDLDVFVANAGSSNITRFVGNGTGALSADSAIPVLSNPVNLVPSDVDHDGMTDLVVVALGGGMTLYMNQGGGEFIGEQSFSCPPEVGDLEAADLNHDGVDDFVIAAGTSGGTVTLLLSDP